MTGEYIIGVIFEAIISEKIQEIIDRGGLSVFREYPGQFSSKYVGVRCTLAIHDVDEIRRLKQKFLGLTGVNGYLMRLK